MNCTYQRWVDHFCRFCFALGVLLLAACSHHVAAPVKNLTTPIVPPFVAPETAVEKSGTGTKKLPKFHVVQIGDTLYSIAWHYGLDFRQLAEINKVSNDFKIFPGEKVFFATQPVNVSQQSLDPERLQQSIRNALNGNKSDKSGKKSTAPVRKSAKITTIHENKLKQNLNKQNKRFTNQNKRVTSSSKGVVSTSRGQVETVSINRWLWPTNGAILSGFSNKLHGNKGLDISGKLGEPVRAAAPGRVVYRGNALKGYGNLVIVKHSDDYLSAYAHNAKIHVQENEIVKAGQVIADIGSSGTDKNKLHFEIRYQGKPVNPMKYLPKL